MRLSVHHTETLTYATPSMGTIQVLRLTPRDHTGHYVCDWSVDVDADCKIESSKDAFGNIVTSFSLNGPLESLTITAVGEVETDETHGIVRDAPDKVPHGVFLRQSHAEGDAALVRTAMNALTDVSGPELAQMHALMDALHAARPQTSQDDEQAAQEQAQMQAQAQSQMGGADGQNQQKGVDDDKAISSAATTRLRAMLDERNINSAAEIAEIFCNTARRLEMPARLVSGYRWLGEDITDKQTRDIWAEVHIDDLGWVAFDPHEGNCPSEDSVRVAIGLDHHAIASARVGHYGGISDVERETRIAVRRIAG
ncbi:MAG: transglutaminase N-terminal domain-containing protein [Hyphomicrobiales bacterium]|jgi:transglutaminase-like putative cysteine protease